MKGKKVFAVLLSLTLIFCSLSIAGCAEDGNKIKNVIVMIGDGMGENHLNLAKQEGAELFMESSYDLRGQSKTRSLMEVTDSAAGATALACGVRVINGTIGVYGFDPFGLFATPRSITETAIAHGMKAGVVTTDSTTGATPAGFSTHVISRQLDSAIADEQLSSDLDLIWGAATDSFNEQEAADNGFSVVTTKEEMQALTSDERSYGQFSDNMWKLEVPEDDASPNLTEMTEKAIALLDNDDGFFLMVEGAHIDKHSHGSANGFHYPEKVANMTEALEEFDNAIEAAVRFAREDGETMVIVTADHETGAIMQQDDGKYVYTSGSHSAANVPLFVYGSDTLIPNGEAVDNKSIPQRIADTLSFTDFPAYNKGPMLKILDTFDVLFSALAESKDLIKTLP